MTPRQNVIILDLTPQVGNGFQERHWLGHYVCIETDFNQLFVLHLLSTQPCCSGLLELAPGGQIFHTLLQRV